MDMTSFGFHKNANQPSPIIQTKLSWPRSIIIFLENEQNTHAPSILIDPLQFECWQ